MTPNKGAAPRLPLPSPRSNDLFLLIDFLSAQRRPRWQRVSLGRWARDRV